MTHYLKSLTYFADADADEEPLHWLRPVAWEEVKEFFKAEIKKLDLDARGDGPPL